MIFALFCALPFGLFASSVSYSNSSAILINDSATPPTLATPYPSTLIVSGLTNQTVAKVTVTLQGFSHQFPDDVDLLLVGPQGQQSFIMSNVGGSIPGYPVTNLTLTLDDDAANPLPLEAPLMSGTFKPTKRLPYLLFDLPVPAPPGNSNSPASFSLFQGVDPDGTWSLFAVDDANPDSGMISGGWNITITTTTTTPVLLSIIRSGTNVVLSWTNTASGYTLQATPSLSTPSVWTNATPGPVDVTGRFTVTNALTATSRFYRLVK